uniref:ARAD1D21714p n=1 Tax=Blastobotrys adeninivorans TaxID=409370 RepID=A0A060TAQ8_BLAAD
MTGPSKAFQPIRVGRVQLGHRIAMAPLTRMRADEKTNVLPDFSEEYYEQRASRPGTLLITEAAMISPEAGGYANAPGIHSKEQVERWRGIFGRIHKSGSFVYSQLIAMGRRAPEKVMGKGNVVAPSDIPVNNGDVPRPLTEKEIQGYVQQFVTAAKNAIEAGADGVELHAANGYLFDQFQHENSNHRTDRYGGSIENRARFTLETIDAVSKAIGADRTAVRFSPWESTGDMNYGVSAIPQWSYLAVELEKRRLQGQELAYVHLTEPRVAGQVDREQKSHESNDFFRQIYRGVLVRAGGLGDIALINELCAKDDKLVIAVGRHFISNPDLINRFEAGIPLNKYHRPTFYGQGRIGYTDYPFAST